jgi:hypothetical protein
MPLVAGDTHRDERVNAGALTRFWRPRFAVARSRSELEE